MAMNVGRAKDKGVRDLFVLYTKEMEKSRDGTFSCSIPNRQQRQGRWCWSSASDTTCSGILPGVAFIVGNTRALRATWGTTNTAKRKVLQAKNKHLGQALILRVF